MEKPVLLRRHQLEMVGVYTSANSANMVYLQAKRNWSVFQFKRKAVSIYDFGAREPEQTVTAWARSLPEMAVPFIALC